MKATYQLTLRKFDNVYQRFTYGDGLASLIRACLNDGIEIISIVKIKD